MEVKIGVQFAARELVVETGQSAEDVAKAVESALGDGAATLTLVDDKGRRVIVPADKLAYVEIGEPEARRVGFGSI